MRRAVFGVVRRCDVHRAGALSWRTAKTRGAPVVLNGRKRMRPCFTLFFMSGARHSASFPDTTRYSRPQGHLIRGPNRCAWRFCRRESPGGGAFFGAKAPEGALLPGAKPWW